jgi:hypothetical protein
MLSEKIAAGKWGAKVLEQIFIRPAERTSRITRFFNAQFQEYAAAL